MRMLPRSFYSCVLRLLRGATAKIDVNGLQSLEAPGIPWLIRDPPATLLR